MGSLAASLAARLATIRRGFHDLGPLRSVFVYVAVLPTLGSVLLLANLRGVAAAVPSELLLASAIAIAVAVAGVLPSAAAFAAGYLVGAERGFWVALASTSLGCTFARVLAPQLGQALFAFMRERPRATAVRRFCGQGTMAAALGVARLRWAAVFPLPVANLLGAVAGLPVLGVLLGNLLGGVPSTLLASVIGDGWRTWRATGEVPEALAITVMAAALVAAAALWRTSRRSWRTTLAPNPPSGR